jgi:hypothetical protein
LRLRDPRAALRFFLRLFLRCFFSCSRCCLARRAVFPAPVAAAPRGQVSGRLERLGLDEGTLVIFDRRAAAPAIEERTSIEMVEHDKKRIRLLRA